MVELFHVAMQMSCEGVYDLLFRFTRGGLVSSTKYTILRGHNHLNLHLSSLSYFHSHIPIRDYRLYRC